LPDELRRLAFRLRYRQHSLSVEITQDALTLASDPSGAEAISIAVNDRHVSSCTRATGRACRSFVTPDHTSAGRVRAPALLAGVYALPDRTMTSNPHHPLWDARIAPCERRGNVLTTMFSERASFASSTAATPPVTSPARTEKIDTKAVPDVINARYFCSASRALS
jgi:hypothetical protein